MDIAPQNPALQLIERASTDYGLAPSYICFLALNDGGFYARLKKGSTYTARTLQRLQTWVETRASITTTSKRYTPPVSSATRIQGSFSHD